MRAVQWIAAAAICALSGCAGNGDGLDENGRPATGESEALQPTFSSIQKNVFTPLCTSCHAGGGAPLALRLEEGASYALLVNAPSVEVLSLLRVQPGNPDSSYLIQKLEGTAEVGARMPLGQPPLPPATIAVIRQWIANGAPNDAPTVTAKPTFALTLAAVFPEEDAVLTAAPTEIVLSASAELDASLLQAGVITLAASGGDGSFGDGNEVPLPLQIVARTPAVLAISPAAPLTSERYELRVRGNESPVLASIGGVLLDGDADGAPGGDFVLHFSVETAR